MSGTDRNAAKRANFELALAALQRFVSEPQRTEAAEAGIIQGFEFTFEQSWKLMQSLGRDEGLVPATPKAAIAAGLKLGLVIEEQIWLDMLRDRNLTSHTYQRQLAQELVAHIETQYVPELTRLADAVRARGE